MSLPRFHRTVINVWAIAVLLFIGGFVATGTPVTWSTTVFPIAVLCVLPAIVLTIFRGAPPRTIAQVIYDEERASDDLAKRLLKIERAEQLDGSRS